MMETVVLVVAAGRGHRFGGDLPKQYALLGGQTVLRRTVQAFLAHPRVDAVRCVIHPSDRDLYERAVVGLDLMEPVCGGAKRQDSVRLGLESLTSLDPHTVLIHDAARPFVSADVVSGVIDAIENHPEAPAGALPAVAVADTLKRAVDGDWVADTVPRNDLFRAQTPQGFRFSHILRAHHKFIGDDMTDDTQLLERGGHRVVLTSGSEDNFKITTSEDLIRAERLLAVCSEIRTAQGYDVHRFGESHDEHNVTLCGVKVPYIQGLSGHSDADVALHALTDALLGTIGAGDIGHHFPPSDAKWAGAASDRFVRHALSLIQERGGTIVNVDMTLVCQAPKIGPHREAMVARVAEILGISQDRVSVKATTTEGLGFTGRKEGIAAQATASVRLPCE